jgi:hypothetical protein
MPHRIQSGAFSSDVANLFPRVLLRVTLGWVLVISLGWLFLLCRVRLLCYSYMSVILIIS